MLQVRPDAIHFNAFWILARDRSPLLMCDLEGCTTGTIGLPNLNQRSVVKTSEFLHPYIYRYTVPGFSGAGFWRSRVMG